MPSYYDSTKTKPGLAEIKYKKGGKVKKMSDDGKTVTTEDRIRDAKIKKELQERIALLRREGKFQRMSAADRAAREKKEEADWAAGIDIQEGGKTTLREKARRIFLPTKEENLAAHARRREEQQDRADALKKSRIKERDRRIDRNSRLQKESQARYDQRRKEAQVRAEALENRKPMKKSGGGQLKVSGMGAATRGGNFIRNG